MDKKSRMFPLARARKNIWSNRLPSYRVENELDSEAMPQYFQVCVNVLEARKLIWSRPEHMNSFVVLTVGNKRRRTSIRKNMENPFYGEYFVFEMMACARDVQLTSVSFAVTEPRCCPPHRMLGHAFIDLSAVWSQPHHQIFHKWAQLTLPKDPLSGPRGFLKIDIGILCRGEVQYIPPSTADDTLEGNLLPATNLEQQRANYLISIFKAWGLPNSMKNDGGRKTNFKPPSTFVRITFCGLVVKTSIQSRSNNPSYNEQFSIVEMFPNLNQNLHIEVCSTENCCHRVLCSTYLRLDEISHDGENGFLPTFGPGPLHTYSDGGRSVGCVAEEGAYYRGSLILSFRTLVPFNKQGLRSVNVEPITPLVEDNYWKTEDFYMFFPLLEVSMLDKRLLGKTCAVSITMGERDAYKKMDEDKQQLYNETKSNKSHYSGPLQILREGGPYGFSDLLHTYPVLQLLVQYPDFRARLFRNNMVTRTIADIEQIATDVESRLASHDYETLEDIDATLERAMDDVAGGIQKFLDIENSFNNRGHPEESVRTWSTELDQKQLAYQRSELMKIEKELRKRSKNKSLFKSLSKISNHRALKSDSELSRKAMKLKLADTKLLIQKLRKLVFKTTEGFPDIVIWLVSRSIRVAYVKISAADIIYSPVEEQSGKRCAKFQTLFLKPVKCPKHLTSLATGCFCITAKIETAAWFGLLRQKAVVPSLLPESYEVNVSGSAGLATYVTANPIYVECRAYVYRAKMSGGADSSGLADPFVRVNIFNQCVESQVKYKSLTPVWNQVLRIQRLTYSSIDRFQSNPASVLVEVYDFDTRDKAELMGRVQIECRMAGEVKSAIAPKLQNFSLYKGKLCTGEILMSVQLFRITDITDANLNEIETLPEALIPQYSTHKIDVYWWGLRGVKPKRKLGAVLEIDDLAIKSDTIMENKANCNFPNGRHTEIFEAPMKEAYCPPLSIRLYDSGTFGRTIFLGTNVLKSPSKFVVDWLPKIERDASVHSASFEIFQKSVERDSPINSTRSSKSSEKLLIEPEKPHLKSKLRSFFSRTHTVAAVTSVKRSGYRKLPETKQSKKSIKSEDDIPLKDWWIRFSCSQKECLGDTLRKGDHIAIFNSELESQEGFSNFKDWCHTLKMYKGKKTGVPEEDEKLYCGFLKAGIVIYKWPPPKNMVAVSRSGVDLDKGFFHDHPNNETRKYLVRVYIVKGLNLMPKDFSGKSDPYVTVKLGKKHLGDRKNYVPKNLNPIFGRLHEFRAVLPEDYLLTVSVLDYDKCSCSDDLIGITVIDIEDRIFTKHRATCGLSSEYCTSGYNKWRDAVKPSTILNQLCRNNHLPAPVFTNHSTVLVNGVQYKDNGKGDYKSDTEKKENLCLNLLKKWKSLPLCGHDLVPEHVETRTLYNPEKPGVDQGKLQMWVDIFPLDDVYEIPSAVVITPKKPEQYELRVVVWNVEGITLDDYDFITGEKASDIYVKAWIGDPEIAQTTDIHYRSLTGEGNFNWRMVFPMQYNRAERRLVFTDTSDWFDPEDLQIPPTLHIVVMDNDSITEDDFLGSLALTLDSMPRGAKSPRYCSLANMTKAPQLNLFNTRSVRGWWPLSTRDAVTGKLLPARTTKDTMEQRIAAKRLQSASTMVYAAVNAGMIDLETHLLTKEKAVMQPVGIGREPPQSLPEPKRPETSFNLWSSPLSSFKRMMKKRGWKSCLVIILLMLAGLIVFATIMDLPKVVLEKLIY